MVLLALPVKIIPIILRKITLPQHTSPPPNTRVRVYRSFEREYVSLFIYSLACSFTQPRFSQ
jgi:hypothetical protein